jgi:hypothetical protein
MTQIENVIDPGEAGMEAMVVNRMVPREIESAGLPAVDGILPKASALRCIDSVVPRMRPRGLAQIGGETIEALSRAGRLRVSSV